MRGRKIENIAALQLALWGLWLLMPWDTFSTAAVFATLSAIVPEWVWGLATLVSGSLWLLVRPMHLRAWLALWAIFYWLIISIAYAVGNYRSTAMAVYPLYIFVAWMAYLEIKRDLS
jgi:hypothetical protein